jgi:hypothetical protein
MRLPAEEKAAKMTEKQDVLPPEETDRCSTNCAPIRMSIQIADNFRIPSILHTYNGVKYNLKQGGRKWSRKIS